VCRPSAALPIVSSSRSATIHRRTGLGERFCCRQADAAAGSGDECHFSVKGSVMPPFYLNLLQMVVAPMLTSRPFIRQHRGNRRQCALGFYAVANAHAKPSLLVLNQIGRNRDSEAVLVEK
jgi:hypothetical protein